MTPYSNMLKHLRIFVCFTPKFACSKHTDLPSIQDNLARNLEFLTCTKYQLIVIRSPELELSWIESLYINGNQELSWIAYLLEMNWVWIELSLSMERKSWIWFESSLTDKKPWIVESGENMEKNPCPCINTLRAEFFFSWK